MNELLKDFLTESSEELRAIGSQIARFEEEPSDARAVHNLFRLVHSIKSACGFLNLPRLTTLTHAAENLFGWLRDGGAADRSAVTLALAAVERIGFVISGLSEAGAEPSGDDLELVETIERAIAEKSHGPGVAEGPAGPWSAAPERRIDTMRVPARALEEIACLVCELVLTRNQISEATRAADAEPLLEPIRRLSSVAADLQLSVQAAKMQPFERLFAGLQQRVRALNERSGKRCVLKLRGGDIELDRRLLEALREPLAQIVDNAAGHGIETPDERRRAGKPDDGVIAVSGRRRAGHVVIEVSDDGRGLDARSIRSRAAALGLGSTGAPAASPETELFQFVFAPGFSIAGNGEGGGGRGGGLEVVRAGLEALGGSVALTSRDGRGATFTLRAPLSPSVAPALVVAAGADRFVAPQHLVEEVVECGPGAGATLEETYAGLMLRTADAIIPAARLGALMHSAGASGAAPTPPLALRLRSGSQDFAIVVDAIVDVQEIVFKPLPRALGRLQTASGCAILGDGEVALILDPAGLGAAMGLAAGATPRVALALEAGPSVDPTKFVVFRTGVGLKALAVSAVARIQPIDPARDLTTRGRPFLRDGDDLVAVLTFGAVPAGGAGVAIIVAEAGARIALVADEIVDIIESEPVIDPINAGSPARPRVAVGDEQAELLDALTLVRSIAATRPPASETAARARVLVVDSPPALRCGLQSAARAAGYESVFVAGAREALSEACGAGYAAILADSATFSSTGGAFARSLVDVQGRQPVSLIGLCEHGGRRARKAALQAGLSGAVGWLDRPALIRALGALPRDAVHGAGA